MDKKNQANMIGNALEDLNIATVKTLQMHPIRSVCECTGKHVR